MSNTPLRPSNASETSELRQLIKELSAKIDTFIQSLPGLYILRTDFDLWRSTTNTRLDTLERDLKEGRTWETNEHKDLANAMGEAERRIVDKIEAHNQVTWGTRLTTIMGAFGWILTIGALILTYILSKH
jgi:hypothetical protein